MTNTNTAPERIHWNTPLTHTERDFFARSAIGAAGVIALGGFADTFLPLAIVLQLTWLHYITTVRPRRATVLLALGLGIGKLAQMGLVAANGY